MAALGIGWIVGELTEISDAALGLLVAFLAGGVILNVMKEELPARAALGRSRRPQLATRSSCS